MAKTKARIEEHIADPRLVDERGPTKERMNKLRPSPINLALEAGKLNQDHGLAAEKYYKHWHHSGMVASLPSIDLDRVFGGEGFQLMPKTENQAFHRDRYRKAKLVIEQQCGEVCRWALEQVVCHERGFTEVGSVFGHKNRTRAAQIAFEMILPPLNVLIREWGIR